jgi:hypothetical protein
MGIEAGSSLVEKTTQRGDSALAKPSFECDGLVMVTIL